MATSGDNPIRSRAEDSLGRDRVARSIARAAREADASEGYVIGILGPWGSGKTSLLNLVREEFATSPPLTAVEFNPWMFSGAEQLVDAFFNEIGAQLRTESKELVGLADDLQRYGEALAPLRFLPVVGPWIERLRGGAGAIKQLLDARRGGIAGLRQRVAKKLASLEQPIVVVLDDIDRLHVDEIRDVFKLVRLTASFPNLIYLVAFDRTRVEAALQEQGLEGRSYLEKILQVSFDIPVLPQGVLVSQLTRAIDAAIDDVPDPGPFESDAWQDVLAEIVFPLIRQMRDVRRYAAAVRATVLDLAGSIALVDVLALEAVQVFLPDTFSALGSSAAGLTTTSQISYGGQESPVLKQQIELLLRSSDSHPEVVRAMVRRLFPAGIRHFENNHYGPDWLKTWLKARRVAHPDVLSLYLERVESAGLLAFSAAERSFSLLGDASAFDQFLTTLDPETIEDVIAALEAYEDDFPTESVVPGSQVLLDWAGRLPERPRGMFGFEARLAVTRVVLRMLRRLETPEAVETATVTILPKLTSLSSRLELINMVGHEEGVGHRLIDADKAAHLERELRQQVRDASPDHLAEEWDVARLLMWTKRTAGPDEPSLGHVVDPALLAALLKDSLTEVRSQSMGSRAVNREPRLVWDGLVELLGGESMLQDVVDDFANSNDPKLAESAALAQRYLAGWRPERF